MNSNKKEKQLTVNLLFGYASSSQGTHSYDFTVGWTLAWGGSQTENVGLTGDKLDPDLLTIISSRSLHRRYKLFIFQ